LGVMGRQCLLSALSLGCGLSPLGATWASSNTTLKLCSDCIHMQFHKHQFKISSSDMVSCSVLVECLCHHCCCVASRSSLFLQQCNSIGLGRLVLITQRSLRLHHGTNQQILLAVLDKHGPSADRSYLRCQLSPWLF